MKRQSTIKAVDIEHCRSAISVESFTEISRKLQGEEGALITAIHMAKRECRLNGGDPTTLFSGPPQRLEVALEEFFKANNETISDFNKANVRSALEKFRREKDAGTIEKLFHSLNPVKLERFMDDLHERNSIMAEGISEAFRKDPRLRRSSGLTVGHGHNDAIERLLERQGYSVCNIKSFNTRIPELDGKIYHNKNPNQRDGAEWVISVFDEKGSKADLFEERYSIEASCPAEKLPAHSRRQTPMGK